MTGTNWRIDHECPQCGGPITLEETDRFFACDYCRARLHITSKGPFQYCLVPKKNDDNLLYIPYWRFKGTAFAITEIKIHHRLMDHTRIASSISELPYSLGFRPQTQPLSFATRKVEGQFVPPSLPLAEVLLSMEKQLAGMGVQATAQDTLEKKYIGETTSIIYAPFKMDGRTLHDAITPKKSYLLKQSLDERSQIDERSLTDGKAGTWHPEFFPALCPHCGWDLNGKRDSCVFVCENCERAWEPSHDGLNEVSMGAVLKHSGDATYIPFWKIRPHITGIQLDTYADLVRMANLPKVVQKQWETVPLEFWIPAFKIRPDVFLRMGGMLTISGPENIVYKNFRRPLIYPITLPLAEAVESLKLILASLVVTKRKNYAKLPGIDISPRKSTLILLPFVSRGNEFIYEEHNMAIQKIALTYGRNF